MFAFKKKRFSPFNDDPVDDEKIIDAKEKRKKKLATGAGDYFPDERPSLYLASTFFALGSRVERESNDERRHC